MIRNATVKHVEKREIPSVDDENVLGFLTSLFLLCFPAAPHVCPLRGSMVTWLRSSLRRGAWQGFLLTDGEAW